MPPAFRATYSDVWPRLHGLSAIGQAAYYRLSCGPDARALPIVSLRINALAADLSVTVQALRPAIAALVERGLLVTDSDSNPTVAYLPMRMAHEKPRALAHHSAWSSELQGYQWARFHSQVLADIGFTPPTPPPTGPSTLPPIRERERERERETDIIPAARVSATTANADRTDDELDELFRSYPEPAAKKSKLAGEEAQINRQLTVAAVALWNNRMSAAGNPTVVPDREWHKRNSRNIAKVVAAAGGLDNFKMLLEFANAEMPYHAGKPYGPHNQVRAWTMAEWCARANIEKVQAGLNSYVMRTARKPSDCQLDWTRKPTVELLGDK
jgi:hypothetical protein